MNGEYLLLSVQRLRDELDDVRSELRRRYKKRSRQVTSEEVKRRVAKAAEAWLTDLSQRRVILGIISSDYIGDLTIHFQRLLTFTEHATTAGRYLSEIKIVLEGFTIELIIPLKQRLGPGAQASERAAGPAAKLAVGPLKTGRDAGGFSGSAFMGHSFSEADGDVINCFRSALQAIGIEVVEGDKPKAERISDKVKRLVEGQYLFVGLFTRRDKISRRNEWTTSAWVIDEKAYAFAKGRKLILLKEDRVGSIGGIQGDYEFIEFSRDRLHDALVRLLELFEVNVRGLRV